MQMSCICIQNPIILFHILFVKTDYRIYTAIIFLRRKIRKPYAIQRKAAVAMYTYTENSTKSFNSPVSVGIALQEPFSDHVPAKRAKIVMKIGDNEIHFFL